MFDATPLCLIAKRLLQNVIGTVERKIFVGVDLDATARGWLVHRDRPFSRTYRDPRWAPAEAGTVQPDRRERCRQS
jgi:hypothetical protein